MIAQNAKMAAPGAWTPAVEGFAPAFVSHQSEDGPSEPAAPGATIAMSRIEPVTETPGRTAGLDAPNLVHASVVCSTIAKGRIVDIDPGAALRVKGVVS